MFSTGVPVTGTHQTTYLGRLIDVPELIASDGAPVSYVDAGRRLAMPASTAHRLIWLLIARGYCDGQVDGLHAPGPMLARPGVQALQRPPYSNAAERAVEKLGRETGESASFGLLRGRACKARC